MGQSGGSRVVCSCRLTMRLPYLPSLLLVVTILPVTLAEPDVFGDYFDDGMKLVDISQDAALRSCLSDGKTADKTMASYDGCYGQGYDFDDLAKAGGDDDGLPDELEEKEGCFYKKMGWVSEDNVMDEAAIAADMEGLENEIQEQFNDDVGTCVAWSGNFGERRKREAGMEVQGESQDKEVVPGLMDTGRRAMGWVKKLVRKVRSPGKNQRNPKQKKPKCNKKNGKCKDRKKKKNGRRVRGRKNKKAPKKKKSGRPSTSKRRKKNKENKNSKKPNGNDARRRRRRKNKTKKSGPKKSGKDKKKTGKPNGNGSKRGRSRKNGKQKKGGKKGGKKNNKEDTEGSRKRSGKKKNDKSLPETVYNKLWCIDLAIEQALEKCVETKIQN